MTTITRPVMRYHGSKFRLAEKIIGLMPEHSAYVEPFGGGAAILMRKPRVGIEVYNDLDGRVVNVFRVLQDAAMAEELIRRLELTPFSRSEFRLARKVSDDPIEDARRMITLSGLGFSSDACTRPCSTGFRTGFYRRGRSGPAKEWSTYPEHIRGFIERLQGVVIECMDGAQLIRRLDRKGTLFLCDPPYLKSVRSAVREHQRCYRHEMTDEQHVELSEVLHGIQGMAMVCGYASPLYDELYGDWRCVTFDARTHAGKVRTEVVWLSPGIQGSQLRFE